MGYSSTLPAGDDPKYYLEQLDMSKNFKFPVVFFFKSLITFDKDYDDILAWCDENIDDKDWDNNVGTLFHGHEYRQQGYFRFIVFAFRSKEDATYFKMVWG